METMRVYRIEDKFGTGPYRRRIGDDTIEQMEMENRHCNPSTHPTEAVDFYGFHEPGERFGFDSMQKLMAWFGPWLPHLLSIGYKISIYEISIYEVRSGRSGKQIMFQSDLATRVDAKRRKR